MIEIVNGIVIGELAKTMRGKLYHNGRPQSDKWFFCNSDEEIRVQAIRYIETMKTDLGDEYRRLYPRGLDLRIWDN